jgi:hypothetical protein
MRQPPRDREVTVTTTKGAKYTYSYATLAACLRSCAPLAEEGVALVWGLDDSDKQRAVTLRLVASDGSKGRTGPDEQMRIGRACIVLDKLNAKATEIGGELDIQFDNFERHSYEAELAAFHDHLAATADTVTVFITDCLSGAQAGQGLCDGAVCPWFGGHDTADVLGRGCLDDAGQGGGAGGESGKV